MIRHIVFFTAAKGIEASQVRRGLDALRAIPHASRFEVAQNAGVDPMGNTVEIVVYGEFADWDALAAFKADPIYADTTAKVRPLREMRLSADFEAEG
ncbi:Dabb family protein [Antarcticirhabdus aurantiaca]|uniref:Dabb family protein n=1 Tax=Antarcticirhabdus aurantiaca TaxID=2606717 RepID=A0ACD4NTT5_9HYPH|nr:Dabb family protein [Antarcticirhabdus aurantiaca]WAJ30110.1 Dabb family protein [Jeongeuplla avenae]